MKKYTYEEIQEMLKPIFEFMSTEYPNDYCLIIKRDSAELYHNSSKMIFLDKPPAEKLSEMANGTIYDNFLKALSNTLKKREDDFENE